MYKIEEENTNRRFWIWALVGISIGFLLLLKLAFREEPKWDALDMGYLGYQKIVFVGDSRVLQMKDASLYENVNFIGECGKGLNWFRKDGYEALQELLQKNTSPQPIAVVFNLGVNDYWRNQSHYVPYFLSIAEELEDQNCYLFYMSVNPVEEKKLRRESNYVMRTNREIQSFNEELRKGLEGTYTWLDLYDSVEEKGYATRDGLHYTTASSQYILTRAIQMLLGTEVYSQDYCWRKKEGNWYAIRWEKGGRVKDAWIEDGKGWFYLDEKGRLAREREVSGPDGSLWKVGPCGRRVGKK